MEKRIEELEKRIKRLENVVLLDVTEENFIIVMRLLGGHEVFIEQMLPYFKITKDPVRAPLRAMATNLVKEKKVIMVFLQSGKALKHCYSLP
jgi:hypothetical protein